MVKALYLIRHGQTEGHSEKPTYKGSLDVPLSALGLKQASGTGRYMKEAGLIPTRVYTSPLQRALMSAEAIAGQFSLTPEVVAGLRERDFGQWEGMSFDEIAAKWPDAFYSWADNPLEFSPMGGESTQHVNDRIVPVIEDLVNRGTEEETIAVVAHGGVNRAILCHYTGVPLSNIFRLEQGFACLNVISFYDGLPVLGLMNHSPQL